MVVLRLSESKNDIKVTANQKSLIIKNEKNRFNNRCVKEDWKINC